MEKGKMYEEDKEEEKQDLCKKRMSEGVEGGKRHAK